MQELDSLLLKVLTKSDTEVYVSEIPYIPGIRVTFIVRNKIL